jgi:hypothetical protein
VFSRVAGNREPPSHRVKEVWAICGRRSGKSRMAAAVGCYLATMTDARSRLVPGETGHVPIISPTMAQSRLVFGYCAGFLERSPLLASQIEGVTADEIKLCGNVVISCIPCSHRTTRGRTMLGAVFDEAAYWRSEESATPDREVYRSVLPALASGGGMLVSIGSPYRRTGLLHQKHRDHYGVEGDDVLVVQGPSATFNPRLAQEIIEAAERDDPESARSEWFAEFRSDLASLLDDTVIDGAIDFNRPLELPPRYGVTYFAFTDASAGRHDQFSLCVGHVEKDCFVADVIRATKPPFDPGSVAAEYAAVAKDYHCRKITGDAYAGEWTAQAFRDAGMLYETSALPKSGLYVESVPYWNRGAVRIPDHPALLRELRLLERRVHRSGRDSVDHPRNGSDDLSNALCGAVYVAVKATRRRRARVGYGVPGVSDIRWEEMQPRARERMRLVTIPEPPVRW